MKKFLTSVLVLCVISCMLSGCDTDYATETYSFYCMNTQAELVISDKFIGDKKEKFTSLCDEIETQLRSVENSISLSVTDSSISKFNSAEAGATVEIDKNCYEVLTCAKKIYTLTGGYYNPAIYYNVAAYGFNEAFADLISPSDRIPPDEEIEKYNSLYAHFGELQVYQDESNRYYAVKPEETFVLNGAEYSMKLDLGGIGKGYAADKVDALIDEYGFENGYFSFGTSSIVCKKHYLNGTYKLGLKNARGEGNYASLNIGDVSLSTSGDYQQNYILDGVIYCHVFDPATGRPVRTGIMTATVIGGSAAEGDALTTAIMAMGKERAVEFINDNLSGLKIVFSYEEDDGFGIITNCPDELTVENENYKIKNSVTDGKIDVA